MNNINKNSCLLLIDLQNDFFEKGSLAVKNSNEILPNIIKLINIFYQNKKKIIATLDWHPPNHKSFASISKQKIGSIGILNNLPQIWWPDHCIENSHGAQLNSKIPKNKIDFFVKKGTNKEIDSYSAFFDNGKLLKTTLDDYLKNNNINTIYALGLATDYCVKFTVIDALELNYKVFVIKDCVKPVNLNENDAKIALKEMQKKGAKLINSNSIKAKKMPLAKPRGWQLPTAQFTGKVSMFILKTYKILKSFILF